MSTCPLLYLVWRIFFLPQPLLVKRNCGEPLLTTLKVVTVQCHKILKQIQKEHVFGHFTKSQRVKFDTNYLKSTTRQHWIRFSCNFLEDMVLKVFFGIFQNPVVSVWYYYLPFLSNIETQVAADWSDLVSDFQDIFRMPSHLGWYFRIRKFSDHFRQFLHAYIFWPQWQILYGWTLQVSSIFTVKHFQISVSLDFYSM